MKTCNVFPRARRFCISFPVFFWASFEVSSPFLQYYTLKKISQRRTKLAASNPSDILSGDGDCTLHYSIGINGMNQIVIADTCRCMPSTSSFGPTWLTPGSSWLRIWLMPTYSGWPHTSKIIKILGTVFNMRKSCRRFNIDEIIN